MSKRTTNVEELMKIAARRRTHHGQLRPLADRLSTAQMNTRDVKRYARRTVAEKILMSQKQIMLVLGSFFGRGVAGRLKWVLTGK